MSEPRYPEGESLPGRVLWGHSDVTGSDGVTRRTHERRDADGTWHSIDPATIEGFSWSEEPIGELAAFSLALRSLGRALLTELLRHTARAMDWLVARLPRHDPPDSKPE